MSKKDSNGAYLEAFDLFTDAFSHSCCDEDHKLEVDDYQDLKIMRLENGWKCAHCGESFRIAVRRLKRTLFDSRFEEMFVDNKGSSAYQIYCRWGKVIMDGWRR